MDTYTKENHSVNATSLDKAYSILYSKVKNDWNVDWSIKVNLLNVIMDSEDPATFEYTFSLELFLK